MRRATPLFLVVFVCPRAAAQAPQSEPSATPRLALIDTAFDLLAAGGGSTAGEAALRDLEGGSHDPKQRGFTIQNVELTFSGVVDPYLRGDANIVLQINETGETVIELEEAYLTTLDLPAGLAIKAGHFLTAFGRHNTIHPHGWDFADAPVIATRLLGGDGLRNPGAQVAWLTPLPSFVELTASVQNAQGETAESFRGSPGQQVAGRTLIERPVREAGDFLYAARLQASFDLGDELTVVPAASAAFGPNATSRDTSTELYGADLYVKWKPLQTDHGWPFVAWQTEALLRRYDAAVVYDRGARLSPRTTLDDYGLYSQLTWALLRPWSVGARYDYARGEDESFGSPRIAYATNDDPRRDPRHRATSVLTYYPSEWSKLRLQYSFDRARFLAARDAHSAYLQCEILFGAHGAHKF